jgi:transcriptional regulator of aromatic amino acid metabolism
MQHCSDLDTAGERRRLPVLALRAGFSATCERLEKKPLEEPTEGELSMTDIEPTNSEPTNSEPLSLEEAQAKAAILAEREELKSDKGFGKIIGRAMDKLYRMIDKAAQSAHPVLILGESGTGKEMVARAIHSSGPFHDKPFVPVDCGCLALTLIESELFRYVSSRASSPVPCNRNQDCWRSQKAIRSFWKK